MKNIGEKSEQFATMALMFRMVLKHFRNYIFALLAKANFMEKEKNNNNEKRSTRKVKSISEVRLLDKQRYINRQPNESVFK